MKIAGVELPKDMAEAVEACRPHFVAAAVFSLFINLLFLTPAIYMLQVYDRVLASRNEMTLLMLTLMVVGAYLFMGALELVRSFVLIRVGAQLDMKMNKRIYTAAFEQNLKRAGGNAGQALQDGAGGTSPLLDLGRDPRKDEVVVTNGTQQAVDLVALAPEHARADRLRRRPAVTLWRGSSVGRQRRPSGTGSRRSASGRRGRRERAHLLHPLAEAER